MYVFHDLMSLQLVNCALNVVLRLLLLGTLWHVLDGTMLPVNTAGLPITLANMTMMYVPDPESFLNGSSSSVLFGIYEIGSDLQIRDEDAGSVDLSRPHIGLISIVNVKYLQSPGTGQDSDPGENGTTTATTRSTIGQDVDPVENGTTTTITNLGQDSAESGSKDDGVALEVWIGSVVAAGQ